MKLAVMLCVAVGVVVTGDSCERQQEEYAACKRNSGATEMLEIVEAKSELIDIASSSTAF